MLETLNLGTENFTFSSLCGRMNAAAELLDQLPPVLELLCPGEHQGGGGSVFSSAAAPGALEDVSQDNRAEETKPELTESEVTGTGGHRSPHQHPVDPLCLNRLSVRFGATL